MPLQVKELIDSLGLEIDPEKATAEDFTTAFNGKFISQDNVLKDETIKTKIVGNVFGKLSTHAAQTFGLSKQDVDGVKFEDILGKIKSKYETQLTDLQKKAGEGNDEKLNAALKKQGELESLLGIKDKSIEELQAKFEATTNEFTGKMKAYKIGNYLSKVKETLAPKFSDEYSKNELVKTGFESHINNTYEFDLDEHDTPVVKLKATGEYVKSKAKAGKIATPEEVFELEMAAKNVLKKNNADSNRKIATFEPPKDGGGSGTVKINPNALDRIAKLQAK